MAHLVSEARVSKPRANFCYAGFTGPVTLFESLSCTCGCPLDVAVTRAAPWVGLLNRQLFLHRNSQVPWIC